MGDAVALLLAEQRARGRARRARGSRRAGRAAAASARWTLRPDSSNRSSTPGSVRRGEQRHPAPSRSPRSGAGRAAFTGLFTAGSPGGNGARARAREPAAAMEAAADHDDVLYVGRAGDPARRRAGARRRPRADALGPRVRAARRAGAQRAGRIVSREELYALVWGSDAARRRPLDRRLRPQAAREARDGAAGRGRFIHTHVGLRLPLLAGAFTRLFTTRPQRGNRLRSWPRQPAAATTTIKECT